MSPPVHRLAFPHELGLAVASPKGTDLVLTVTATVPKGQGLGLATISPGQVIPFFKADPSQLAGTATATASVAPTKASQFTVHFAGGSVEQLSFAKGQSQAISVKGWAVSSSRKLMGRRGGTNRLVVMALASNAQPGRLRFTTDAATKTVTATYFADNSAPYVKVANGLYLVGGELPSGDLPAGLKLVFGNDTVNIIDDQAPDHVVVMDLALAASTLG